VCCVWGGGGGAGAKVTVGCRSGLLCFSLGRPLGSLGFPAGVPLESCKGSLLLVVLVAGCQLPVAGCLSVCLCVCVRLCLCLGLRVRVCVSFRILLFVG